MSDLTEWSIEWVIDWLQKEFDSKNNSKLHVNKSLSVNKRRRGRGGVEYSIWCFITISLLWSFSFCLRLNMQFDFNNLIRGITIIRNKHSFVFYSHLLYIISHGRRANPMYNKLQLRNQFCFDSDFEDKVYLQSNRAHLDRLDSHTRCLPVMEARPDRVIQKHVF